jgi:L-fuculose-phosphate aldolase
MLTDWEIRREIVAFGKKVYEKGLVSATDGNISVRVMSDRLMITPSGASLGNLNTEDLVYADLTGQVLAGRGKPSSELPMHLEIYRHRPHVNAVMHAHPPFTTAFTVAGESLASPVLPEVVIMFGEIPVAPYGTPASEESAQSILNLIPDHDVIVLDHHGAVTLGKSLEDAFFKMEKLEHAASTLLAAKQIGGINPLTPSAVEKLESSGGSTDTGYR